MVIFVDGPAADDYRATLTACGFQVATAPFAGAHGNPCYHARKIVDGDWLQVSIDPAESTVTIWGTPDVITVAEAARRFAVDPDKPALPWLDRVRIAGFRDLQWCSGDALSEKYGLRHYWAHKADGSRWLILAESESLICQSDTPLSYWKLDNAGQLYQDRTPADGAENAREVEAPAEPPHAESPQPEAPGNVAAAAPVIDPARLAGPVQHSGRRLQTSLF